jgi:hypothetical protein
VLDVTRSPELQAAVLTLKTIERDLVRDINKNARQTVGPVWGAALASKASSRMDQRGLVPGARVAVGARKVTAQAATSRRKLSGGLIPAVDYGGLEWGANARVRTVHARSRKGKQYSYKRTSNKQFRPWSKKGHVAMRAAGDIGPAIVSSWLSVIVEKLAGNFEVR